MLPPRRRPQRHHGTPGHSRNTWQAVQASGGGQRRAFPDAQVEVTNQVAAPDGVATEFTGRGTHTGPLGTPTGALPPTGRAVEIPGAEVWHVRAGQLARLHLYFDTATLLRQLGVLS